MKQAKRKRMAKPNRVQPLLFTRRLRESGSILLAALALFSLTALFSFHPTDPGWSQVGQTEVIHNMTGRAGALLADILLSLFGYIAYLVPMSLGTFAVSWYQERNPEEPIDNSLIRWLKVTGFIMALMGASGLSALYRSASHLPMGAGGLLGSVMNDLALSHLSYWGETILLIAILLAGLTLLMGISWVSVLDYVGRWVWKVTSYGRTKLMASLSSIRTYWFQKRADLLLIEGPLAEKRKAQESSIWEEDSSTAHKPETTKTAAPRTPPVVAIVPKRILKTHQEPLFKPTTADKTGAPSLSLLEAVAGAPVQGYSERELQVLSELVERRLKEFGVDVKVVLVSPGPVITRFELDLAPGVKVSKIAGLAKDLARALSIVSVRVVDIIPGKSTVGLEIPNQEREIVRLKEILEDPTYQNATSPVTLGLGKDISGQVMVADLSKMPHLLVAGTTGSGKSVGLNAMLLSILYKSTPEDVRLIMIDPKMLELAVYDHIPHLLTPVVTDMKEAANALRWCVGEMERRYQVMAALGVRNLAGYNVKVREANKKGTPIVDPLWVPQMGETNPAPTLEPLPTIVVLIDEFADMMMVVGKKVEELIARIAQKARAAGIHLILATQRPSVDVITGLIKANIPTRIAFQVSSRIDSRTILDQSGAEQLLGHGDMLYLPPGTGVPVRIHGAFVADEEVHKVVNELRSRGKPSYVDSITQTSSIPNFLDGGGDEGGESDEFYDEAVALVIEARRVSVSFLQRRFKIGYNRAARLVEQMELSGVVSPIQSNGAREVLVGGSSGR